MTKKNWSVPPNSAHACVQGCDHTNFRPKSTLPCYGHIEAMVELKQAHSDLFPLQKTRNTADSKPLTHPGRARPSQVQDV